MPIAVRARTLFFYMLITFVLTYILGIAYFLALLDAIYRHPMDGPGFVIFWEMSWFGGAVAGIFIKFLLETRNQIRRYEGLIY